MKFRIIKNKQLIYLTISLLAPVLCSSFSYSQTYPLQGSLILKAPHSPYVSDYTTVDNNPLTLTFLNQDASFSGEVVFRLSMKGVGISIQSTNPGTIPISTPLAVPVLLSGSDLASYFSSSNLSFSGYSKTQYDQKGTLPEGLYEFSFQAFDARRNDIAVSNVASFMCWIQLHDPPQLIFPKNQSTAESKTPQQVSFQWQGTTLTNVTYELELYELRVTDKRDPNEVIRGASPIFTTTTKASTYIYTIKDPPLQDGLNYAWRVRAKTDTDKELIKNGGYSSTFTFTYLPTCKTPSLVKSLPSKNKTALISWAGEGKEYLIQYREEGQTDWYEELSLTESLTITQLRPGRRYEYRIKSICEYNYSNYTKTDTFSIPYATNTTPLTPPAGGYPGIVLDKSTYLEEAAEGMIIKVNYFEMKIIKAVKNEQTKLWTGTGTMYFPSLKANVLMEFKDIHINKDQRLVAGHIYGVRAPKLMTKVKLPTVKKAKKICLTYGPDGYDEEGYNKDGYSREGYNKEGRDKEGYDKLGYNQNNLDRNGNPKQTPPTQGNPTASTGTNGNNTTQTGTNGSTSGQGGSGGNSTTTGTNGNSGGATPTTSIEEDAFTLELVSYYEQVIVAYLTQHPELKGSGPEPWYGGNTTQLPPCLEDHKEDIEYIRQYLSVSKNDKAKRAELIQKMKSNDSFMGFFSQAITEKKKTGNEKKSYKELLSNSDWVKLAEKTCKEVYESAGKYSIEVYLKGFESWECYGNAAAEGLSRLMSSFDLSTVHLIIPEASYAAMLSLLKCATDEKHCSGEGYWVCYTYGMMRGIVDQVDFLSLTDGAKELIRKQYKNKFDCLVNADGLTFKFQGEHQRDEAIHLILKCGLGIDITLQEIKTRYDTLQSYINRNWESPYLRGQATIFLATIILPTVAKIGTTAKAALLSKLENTSVLSKELNTIKALEKANGELDEIAKVMKGVENVGDDLATFLTKNIDQKLDNISAAWKAAYPQIFFERKLFEDMMGYYRYSKSAGWGHTADIANNFKAIDFYNEFSEVGNNIYSKTAVSMKTTTTKNVDAWLGTKAIKDNIENLSQGLGLNNGIKWSGKTIYYNKAEIHIYMPKENITTDLKSEWLNKLSNEIPNVKFEIYPLEDFIK